MRVLSSSLCALGLLVSATAYQSYPDRSSMPRTVVTTDLEQDDLASLIRYLLYTNELDTQGIIYTSSRFHWAGDGNGTKFFLEDREYDTPQWNWRWTGTRTVQDIVLKAYAEVWPNLNVHDPFYPTPDELLSIVKIGNVDFEGEMEKDTEGSDFIRDLLLDDDDRTLYLQAWGGTNVIARALKSIEDEHSSTGGWNNTKAAISRKAVILASGFQDTTYADYIAPNWPALRVEDFSTAYKLWAYNCERGQGNVRGGKENVYFTGNWTKANIQKGPYGSLYRSWLDNQRMPGDALDVFGNLSWYENSKQTCQPLEPYAFLSEGDNVVFNPILNTGLQDPSNPTLGSWGGRAKQNSSSPDLWVLVDSEKNSTGSEDAGYTYTRWIAPVQNDFAARMQWTLEANYTRANHAPTVQIANETSVQGKAGTTIDLAAEVNDPDNDTVQTSWWQYLEEGTYPRSVAITELENHGARMTIPEDAEEGDTISIVLQGTDDGEFPLTRYDRVVVTVV
ncbi:DUF1593 domain-containing protein [Aspergillus mulundensis]|uniref:DUF1593-domain-containing protein n=1 Tax=Aspergillus mulundensis TaxID=1810919 RepID=A0A3D8RZS5_9EURO|nr:Uncharacterized protein DSM5745_06173 [Aspergillus mulundensis]RDW79321.1 Uncharacterized protein DSM5745_06173 [Aspergillus mulundensis]